MASTNACAALSESVAEWENYRSSHTGTIDFTLAELKGVNLSGRNLSLCDFSGADLENANLDGCKIHDAIFRNAFLTGASLVSCHISSSIFTNANMSRVVLRETQTRDAYFSGTRLKEAIIYNSRFHNCTFDKSDLQSIKLELTNLQNCVFSNINSNHVSFMNSDFLNCTLSDSVYQDSKIRNLRFLDCSLRDIKLLTSVFESVDLLKSTILRFDLDQTHVTHLNLSGSALNNVDLSNFDLPNTVFLDTAINNCDWPPQKGTTSILGKYKFSPYLLGFPVQDVKGLTPTLRREIADAQFIVALSKNTNPISRLFFRLWGATTDYGQSLPRLTMLSVLFVILLSFLFLISSSNVPIWPIKIENAINAIKYISSSFIGFEIGAELVFSRGQDLVLFIARILGFFILGLWIGLAANQLGKLSSE